MKNLQFYKVAFETSSGKINLIRKVSGNVHFLESFLKFLENFTSFPFLFDQTSWTNRL